MLKEFKICRQHVHRSRHQNNTTPTSWQVKTKIGEQNVEGENVVSMQRRLCVCRDARCLNCGRAPSRTRCTRREPRDTTPSECVHRSNVYLVSRVMRSGSTPTWPLTHLLQMSTRFNARNWSLSISSLWYVTQMSCSLCSQQTAARQPTFYQTRTFTAFYFCPHPSVSTDVLRRSTYTACCVWATCVVGWATYPWIGPRPAHDATVNPRQGAGSEEVECSHWRACQTSQHGRLFRRHARRVRYVPF